MKEEIHLLDVVALLSPLESGKLPRGAVGTVVEVLNPGVFLVEFSDDNGVGYAFPAVEAENLLKLHRIRHGVLDTRITDLPMSS